MASEAKKMEELRDFIAKTNLDAVDVIEKAIVIAASDQPEKLVALSGPLMSMILRCSLSCTTTLDPNVDVYVSCYESRSNTANAPATADDGNQEKEENPVMEEQNKIPTKDGDEEFVRNVLLFKDVIVSAQDEVKDLPLQKVQEEEKLIPSKVQNSELIPSKDKLNKPIISTNDVSIQIEKEELSKQNLNKPIPSKDVSVQKKELPQQKADDKKLIPSNDKKLHPVEQQLKEKIANSKRKLQEGYQMEANKKRKILVIEEKKPVPSKRAACVKKKFSTRERLEKKLFSSKDKLNMRIPSKNVAASVQNKQLPQQKVEDRKLIPSKYVAASVPKKELPQQKVEENKPIPSKYVAASVQKKELPQQKVEENKSIASKYVAASVQKKELPQQKYKENKCIPSKDKLHPDDIHMKELIAAAKRKLRERYQMDANKKRKIITVTNVKDLPN